MSHTVTVVAVEDIPAGATAEVHIGARSTVYRARPDDPIAFATAAAERARDIRAGWNQQDRYPEAPVGADDLLHLAWGIIANVGVHGDGWEGQHPEWVQAAIRWRNAYFDTLPRTVGVGPPTATVAPPEPWQGDLPGGGSLRPRPFTPPPGEGDDGAVAG